MEGCRAGERAWRVPQVEAEEQLCSQDHPGPAPRRGCWLPLQLTSLAPHRYGNTSSSTVWYSFGFCEAVTGVKRGDVVWQVQAWGMWRPRSRALRALSTALGVARGCPWCLGAIVDPTHAHSPTHQIAFGSGFKCNSAVWRALRSIDDKDHAAWQHIYGREGEAMVVLGALASTSKVGCRGI